MTLNPNAQPVVILGAGHGKRMGGPKVFATMGKITFLAHVLNRVREAGSRAILTVDPLFRSRLESLLTDLPPVPLLLVEADGSLPMLSSVQAAMTLVEDRDAGAWLWPVDAPLLSSVGWRKACAAITVNPNQILKLRTGGKTGHPTWFPHWACKAIIAGNWDEGLLGFLASIPATRIAVLELPGEILNDFNTPDQLSALQL